LLHANIKKKGRVRPVSLRKNLFHPAHTLANNHAETFAPHHLVH
jgi:hypothetical protein